MSLTTRPLRLHLMSVLSAPLPGATVTLHLSTYQSDDVNIVPLVWTLLEDPAVPGDYIGPVWPNTRGGGGTHYDLLVQANGLQLLSQLVTVPEGASEAVIRCKVNAPPYPAVYEATRAVAAANTFSDAAGESASLALAAAGQLGNVAEAVETAVAAAGQATLAEANRLSYEDRVYPGVYSTPPTNKPHSGAPSAEGDRCTILVSGVAFEHLRVGGGWLIPNVDAAQLALGSGGQRVGFIASGPDSVKNTVSGKLAEVGYSVTDAMTALERDDVLGRTGSLDVSDAFTKAFAHSLFVIMPEGRFFAPRLKIPTGGMLLGAGVGRTVLVGTPAASGEITGTSGVSVRGITFQTWLVALVVTQSLLDRIDISACEFVACGKSLSDRTAQTRTIDATKVVKHLIYWDNIDRDGEKAVSLCCLLQGADVQFNTVRRMAHPTQATVYTLGSEDGTDTVYDSFGVVFENNDIDGVTSTGLNAETHAVMVMAKNSSVCKNKIHNVRNTNPASVNGTEGIYMKAPDSVVDDNDLLDAGLGQGSICLKNKNTGTIAARRNRIRYVSVLPLASPNFLTGVYASELAGASVDLTDNAIFGAQRPIAVPSEPGLIPEKVSIKRNHAEGDFFAAYYAAAARYLEIEDNFAKQTAPAPISLTPIGVFCTAAASAVDVMSIKGNKTVGIYRSVVVAYSSTASIALLRLKGNDCGVNSAFPGNRGLTYSGSIAALDLGENDLSTPTTKVVGTPPATFFCRSNAGYRTGNGGTATIGAGSTFIDVAHGLAIRPRSQDISVKPANGMGLAAKFFVSNVTDNFFRITVNVAPGADTAIFDWGVRAYEA